MELWALVMASADMRRMGQEEALSPHEHHVLLVATRPELCPPRTAGTKFGTEETRGRRL